MAEKLLSCCRAIDVDEELSDDEGEFSYAKKKDEECETALENAVKWLEVLFRSGLAPDHSAQCQPHLEDRAGDRAYFRSWLPDGDSQILRSHVFGPSALKDYGSATLRCKI